MKVRQFVVALLATVMALKIVLDVYHAFTLSLLLSPVLPDEFWSTNTTTIEGTTSTFNFCINAEFQPSSKTSIWTRAPTSVLELQSVLVLGASLQNVSGVDLVLFGHMGERERDRVQQFWSYCHLHNLNQTTMMFSFLWGMTIYDRIIYMEQDTLVVGTIQDLVQFNVTGEHKIGAAGNGGDTFDEGIFVLHPNADDFKRLSSVPRIRTLNAIFQGQWYDIGFQNNANVALYHHRNEYWRTHTISVLRYAITKPWDCAHEYMEVCRPWLEVYRGLYAHATMPCRNLDFVATEKVAVVTMNTGKTEFMHSYVDGTVVLGVSILEHSKIPVDLIQLELITKPVPDNYLGILANVGWKRCLVDRIPPPIDKDPMPQYRDQFSKLNTWLMTEYESVVYMDSDNWVLGPIDGLLGADLAGNSIGVVRDYITDQTRHGWVDTFNMGVFKIHPNKTEFERLKHLLDENSVTYEVALSEQGWLNVIYNGSWKELSHSYNSNVIAVRLGAIPHANISVLHFTNPKMTRSCRERRFQSVKPYCDAWKEAVKNYTTHYNMTRAGTLGVLSGYRV